MVSQGVAGRGMSCGQNAVDSAFWRSGSVCCGVCQRESSQTTSWRLSAVFGGCNGFFEGNGE